MSEAEKLQTEKLEAEKRAEAAIALADTRLVRAAAIEALATSGVPVGKRDYALRMLQLDSIDVDDGTPDAKAIETAVKVLLADVPELAAKPGEGASSAGSEFGGTAGRQPLTEDYIGKMPPEELKARMPEVKAFYAARRK
jgi:hypothetical protein